MYQTHSQPGTMNPLIGHKAIVYPNRQLRWRSYRTLQKARMIGSAYPFKVRLQWDVWAHSRKTRSRPENSGQYESLKSSVNVGFTDKVTCASLPSMPLASNHPTSSNQFQPGLPAETEALGHGNQSGLTCTLRSFLNRLINDIQSKQDMYQ